MSKKSASKPAQEVLYRAYGETSTRFVSLCPHLRAELDDYLMEGMALGARLKVSREQAARLGVETFLPTDATEKERFEFGARMTRMFFWERGTTKCQTCGHIARGALSHPTREEREQWERKAEADVA